MLLELLLLLEEELLLLLLLHGEQLLLLEHELLLLLRGEPFLLRCPLLLLLQKLLLLLLLVREHLLLLDEVLLLGSAELALLGLDWRRVAGLRLGAHGGKERIVSIVGHGASRLSSQYLASGFILRRVGGSTGEHGPLSSHQCKPFV